MEVLAILKKHLICKPYRMDVMNLLRHLVG